MKRFLVLPLLIVLAGCSSLEKEAYKVIVSAKAFLDAEKKMHPECSTSQTSNLCSKLDQATAAKDLLIDAAEEYCAGPQFEAGGACQSPSKGSNAELQAAAKLKAALDNYNKIAADLKGVLN